MNSQFRNLINSDRMKSVVCIASTCAQAWETCTISKLIEDHDEENDDDDVHDGDDDDRDGFDKDGNDDDDDDDGDGNQMSSNLYILPND